MALGVGGDVRVLREARVPLGFPTVAFTDPSLSAGELVKAVHWNELRGIVR